MTREETIAKIKELKPFYFSTGTLNYFEQKLSDFKHVEINNVSILYADSKFYGKSIGLSAIGLNTETNETINLGYSYIEYPELPMIEIFKLKIKELNM